VHGHLARRGCLDELADALFQLVADAAHLLERLTGWIIDAAVFDGRSDVGQAALQCRVIAQSACSCISRSSFFGRRPAMGMPISPIASTTFGQISRAGSSPADSARLALG
jgi:hypothetical protein